MKFGACAAICSKAKDGELLTCERWRVNCDHCLVVFDLLLEAGLASIRVEHHVGVSGKYCKVEAKAWPYAPSGDWHACIKCNWVGHDRCPHHAFFGVALSDAEADRLDAMKYTMRHLGR